MRRALQPDRVGFRGYGMKTIVVIGAGIVGVSTALWLKRDGFDVVLIDREGPAAGTSYGNGGVLASAASVPVTGPGLIKKIPRMLLDPRQPLFLKWGYLPKLAPWLVKYLSHANAEDTRRIARAVAGVVGDSVQEHLQLADGTKAARWIVPSDYLYLYKTRADFEAEAFSWKLRQDHGITWQELSGADVSGFEPSLAPDLGFAIKMPDHGRITDPGQYVKDLCSHFQSIGGRYLHAEVEEIARENGAVSGVRAGGALIDCADCVLATGVWSGPLARSLGIDVPLESERGYHIELWDSSVRLKTPMMFAAGKFVATPMEGRLRLAGIVEFGGLTAPPSRPPFDLLLRSAKAAFPDITYARAEEWMGHRPAPSDSIPVIGEAPGLKGAWMGFGHHHIGLTAGPKTGRLLAQMIAGKKPNLDVTPYSPARFALS